MPIVPGDPFVPSVMPQGQAAYNTIDRATPGSFGGQVGQTLDQAGNQLMQHAVQRQQLANETAVQDIYANQFSPQARAIVQNYMKLEGKDAEAQFPAFEQKINDLRNQTRESLNPYQQKLFDARSTHRIEADLDGMARYGASQTKAWEWNTHNAVLGDLTAEAEANYNNPQRLQNIVERMDNETIDYGSKHGWSSDVFQYQRGQNQDKLWSAVIKRQALYDPAGAMKTYRDNVEMGRISGVAQGELDKFFKPIQELGQAQAAYGKATGGATAQAIAGEAARQGVDPSTALTIWSAEGGVTNPATPNARGSPALGIFQFMPDTWAAMGGTDRNRLDAARQVQLGIALTKQNSDALRKDLGRQPQPWEVYLAHQQGIEGATALIHADPNANAGDIVGNPKAITQNGGTPGMTVSQFINYIKGYVDRHSMMYAANGVPTAQNLTENYEAGLQAVTDLAREEHPGDPQAEERYRSYYLQQTGQQIHAEKMTNQANWNTVRASLTGPAPVKSWREFISDPRLLDAYNSIYKSDPSAYSLVDKAITTNAMSAWDPPATDETNQLYDNLNGMQCTNRDGFSSLNLMQYYGGMPVSQFNQLLSDQNKIRNHDATQATKLTNLNASINAVRDLRTLAAASSESPFYKMDFSSPLLPEQKWNEFVSRFGQALEDWRQNNNGKIPTDMQKREIAQEILFTNRTAGQLVVATKGNANPSGTNTGTNTNADTNVLESTNRAQINGVPGRTEGVPRDADSLHIAGRDAAQEGNPFGAGAEGMPELWDFPKHPGVTRTDEVPSDAVAYYTRDRQKFLAPPQADWSAVYEAGKANGLDPIAAWRALGYFGAFDFQRQKDKNLFISKYTDASNYAVGVYMRGAGFSLAQTKFIAGLFAHTMSSNAGKPEQSTWWTNGWNDADSGEFAKQSESMQDIE